MSPSIKTSLAFNKIKPLSTEVALFDETYERASLVFQLELNVLLSCGFASLMQFCRARLVLFSSNPVNVLLSPGIACIALSFVDAKGCALQVPAQDGSGPALRGDISSISLQPDQFETLTTVVKVDSGSQSSGWDALANAQCLR